MDFGNWCGQMNLLAQALDMNPYLLSPHQMNRFQCDLADLIGAEKKGHFAFDLLPEYKQWWRQNDWRGKKGQPPTIPAIRETWTQFLSTRKQPQSTPELCGTCEQGIKDNRLCPCVIKFRDTPWDSTEHQVLIQALTRLNS